MTGKQAFDYLRHEIVIQGNAEGEASRTIRYIFEDLIGVAMTSDELLDSTQMDKIFAIREQILQHIPWQYICGSAPFYGYSLFVNKDVLIPRPETEELVHNILSKIKTLKSPVILDVGTGSGAIALVLSLKRRDARVIAIDVSEEALKVAKLNASKLNAQVTFSRFDFLDSSLWKNLPEADVVISNPPYITLSEINFMGKDVVIHEPHTALFVRQEPMEFYSAIRDFVIFKRNPCLIAAEINEFRAAEVKEVFSNSQFTETDIVHDMQGKERMIFTKFHPEQ